MIEKEKLKKFINFRIVGIIGSILLIISQFLSWFSGFTLLNIYSIYISFSLGESFLFLFPLISGIVCALGTILVFIKSEYKINAVIINFMGLGFFLLFIFEIVTKDSPYIGNAQIGFYFAIIGAILVFFDVLNILMQEINNNKKV